MLSEKNFKSFICIFAAAVLLINSTEISLAVKNGMKICYDNIIGAMFPFMVLTHYITGNNLTEIISLPFSAYSRLLKIKDESYPAFLSISLLGGFATGSVMLKSLENKGYDTNTLCTIAPSMINNSMAFCVVVVGNGLCSSILTGTLLYCSLVSSSLITTFLLSFVYEYNIVSYQNKDNLSRSGIIECLEKSVNSILSVCSFVIISAVMCEVISLYIHNKNIASALFYLTEVTSGCMRIALNSRKNYYLLCIVLSILPLSTLCQVFHFTHNIKIVKTLLLSRVIHTPLSVVIFSVLCNIFPSAVTVIKPEYLQISGTYSSFEISAALYAVVFCFIFISSDNKIFTYTKK